jgi:serine/threonine protein kinase
LRYITSVGRLDTNDVFAGRYRILGHLGSGGMGHVYRAEHVGLRKPVALKVLGKRSAEYVARFEREARAIARLDHVGCVRIFDHGTDDRGVPYIAMELIDGPTLALALSEDTFAIPRALNVTRALLVALAHAHAHGVVHRDLKPENIMFAGRRIDSGGHAWRGRSMESGEHWRGRSMESGEHAWLGRPVIIDFGLASLADAAGITGNGFAMGSPSYIAPERLRGEPHDARADVYAVGVILYEMLAGLRPFLGSNPQEIMTNALSRPPRPLRAVVPEVSPALDAVIRRALAKDPDKRYADAEDMLSALDEVALLDARAVDDGAFDGTVRGAFDTDEGNASASRTMAMLELSRPSLLSRAWSWLRYGAWRWRSEPSGEVSR